ncbi:uncharacterized protein LOC126659478 [Mercurialis annua]|uniref:uncharacterized protein LOC126659478 n=1 Tax=Mercurialis annua TaxID=3986 RepID=UPI00215FD52B|nr:uncharacterized protein LOC126659478 [Mercurialis annua]
MSGIYRSRSLHQLYILWFFVSISLQFISGIYGDESGSKNDKKADAHTSSHSSTSTKVLIVLIVIVALGLFSFFLFKFWQKKKREEQYARLLKLFEEDDELEVELGLRD